MRIEDSKNVKHIAPILASVFIKDFALTEHLIGEYQLYYNAKLTAIGALAKYLNNQMSDYEILSIDKDEDTINMVINDLNYCLLAEEVLRERGLESEIQNVKFPFSFLFQGIKHYTINEVEQNGELVEIHDHCIIQNSQILFDQLIYIDDNIIEIGFSLWKYIEGEGRNFLLLISAKTCNIDETQIELFNKLVNENVSDFKL